MILVVVADDHHLVRQGISALLEKESDILVIGQAEDGFQALEVITELKPDVAVLDVAMPNLNGLEVLRQLRDQQAATRVLMLSMYAESTLVRQALNYGAYGYLVKRSLRDELIEGVRAVSGGKIYISQAVRKIVSSDSRWDRSPQEPVPFERLTSREVDVLTLMAKGKSNQEIAENLNISIKTVEKHRANLIKKLGTRDLLDLVRIALRYGLIFLDE